MKKKIIIITIIIALGLFLFFKIKGSGAKKNSNSVKTVAVERKDLIKSVSASGRVASDKEVELKFQTSGQLAWVGVKLGETVKPWQAIAQLDKRELELNLKKYLKDYLKERWDLEEDQKVTYRDKVLTDTIKRILEKNQFDLDKAVMDVEIKDLAIQFATLITPIAGIVTQVDTPIAGVNITPSTAVFRVSDPDELIFKADVDEVDIGNVMVNQKVKITFDAYPDSPYEGRVSRIDFIAKTTAGGGTAFTVEVKIPQDPNLKYKLGMNGDIEIIEKEVKNVLSLPNEAIRQEGNSYFVYLNSDNLPLKKIVKIGLVTDSDTQITEGLIKGEKVIIGNIKN